MYPFPHPVPRPSLPQRPRRLPSLAVVAVLGLAAGACGTESSAGGSSTVVVNIGYQSKTINTVTAGTLLRDRGTFERKLNAIGKAKGVRYKVVWQDFPSGPPLTAQMIAGKVDIGSMGDYPVLVNGSKTAEFPDAKSELVAVTGYNLRGSLNQVVVPKDSPAQKLTDLRGKVVSTSVGSAAHGMLVNALRKNGLSPDDVKLLNQEPAVGASALEGEQVAALSQFVPWPQLMVFRRQGRLLYDGGSNGVPTFHAVISREAYADDHPEVMRAFLESVRDTADHLNKNPLAAAEQVAKVTGIEPEVIYLYNGPSGLVTFDPTIKPQLVDALSKNLPFLKDLGSVKNLDLGKFVNDGYLRKIYGPSYDAASKSTASPSTLSGQDPVCHVPVKDPRTASEVWFGGQESTGVAATPTCLLRRIAAHDGGVRAAYVPDAKDGTRMFASAATWVLDPGRSANSRLLPFAVAADADSYLADHSDARKLGYEAALKAAS
ncbi:ABC transporter substrate-binding protein [Streptomyces tirandamycinicus]|uniref:ABC transporter substrate-binding protein n=1 Tax=Streptomyces tirandamycinicus TaxID=2174846 RepID=A0A2S1SYI0_9ACTN|nr:ABC transporter substrate-binding protein [Streptomyces tirandamycinicus]AWI31449.1 ABC transporter substrate-binding protein [Streptomyces tirandamycinicus]